MWLEFERSDQPINCKTRGNFKYSVRGQSYSGPAVVGRDPCDESGRKKRRAERECNLQEKTQARKHVYEIQEVYDRRFPSIEDQSKQT